MSFTVFSESTTANANEVVENFYHIWQGDRMPLDGDNLEETTGTINIGEPDNYWSGLYCETLNIYNSISTTDNTIWYLLSETELSAAATSIEVTGINGDSNSQYMIELYHIDNGLTTSVDMILNGDSASNYGYLSHLINTATSGSNTAITIVNGSRLITTTGFISYAFGILNTKTGCERDFQKNEMSGIHTSSSWSNYAESWVWNNSVNTITSIKIIANQANGLNSGTTLLLWGQN